jgi:hypothetical protein
MGSVFYILFFIYFWFCRARPNLHVVPENSIWRDVGVMSVRLVHYITCTFDSKILKPHGKEILNIFVAVFLKHWT